MFAVARLSYNRSEISQDLQTWRNPKSSSAVRAIDRSAAILGSEIDLIFALQAARRHDDT